jgi:hypothetical protein
MNACVLAQTKPASKTVIPPARNDVLQRKRAGGGIQGPTDEWEKCRKKGQVKSDGQSAGHDFGRIAVDLQPKLTINQASDRFEQEADRLADAVTRGGVSSSPLISSLGKETAVQREELGKITTEEEKYDEAAKKAGEAFLKTALGKDIKKKAEELGDAFISTLLDKPITGTAIAGVVTALGVRHKDLPIGIPEIPLDTIKRGLKVKVTYEGPMDKATNVMATFSFSSGGGKSSKKKPRQTESEKFRSQTAQMPAGSAKFPERLKTPGDNAAEGEMVHAYVASPVPRPRSSLGTSFPDLKLTGEVQTETPKKREEETVQRKATCDHEIAGAPPIVDEVLQSPGEPLTAQTRRFFGERFGYDFGAVRIHRDARAAESARAVHAQAYTVGRDIVFNGGEFAPETEAGRRLLAHELTHVIQQSSHNSGGSSTRILQRKPRADAPGVDPSLRESRAISADDAAVANLLSLQDGNDRFSMSGEVRADTSIVSAAPERTPRVEFSAPSEPKATEREAQTSEPGRLPAAAGAEPRIDQVPAAPAAEMPRGDESSMPRLATLLAERRTAAVGKELGLSAAQLEGATHSEISRSLEVDIAELLGILALGAGTASKTINHHATAARSDIDRGARRSSKKLEDQTKSADDAVRAMAGKRHNELDKTILAHKTEVDWLEKRCREDATIYANNARAAQRDGFAFYRGRLANAFDHWSRRFDKLNQRESGYLTQMTAWNLRRMWRMYTAYEKQFIQGIGNQSEERRDVQREAAREVVENYAKEFEKANTEVLPELAKACEEVKAELNKSREQALIEYDKGLPVVLKGIDEQLAAALKDISNKATEARAMLDKAASQMRQRVTALEENALKRNAAFHTKIDGQIETGRASLAQEFRRATPRAMEPIATIIDEAVGILTNSDEELDADASRQFVDEVVDFSLDAADATGEVFAAARDASIGTLADAVPFAKRGFAAGKKDLETTLHAEGAENESALINFGAEAEKYVRSPLTDLDETFNTGVSQAKETLMSVVTGAANELREPMETTEGQIRGAVKEAVFQQNDAYSRLGRDMHHAARQAAWRYDHPIMRRVVSGVEIFLGVVGAILAFAGLVLALPFIVGEAAALVITAIVAAIIGFSMGYFGAKAYDERRKAGADRLPALLGAIGDVTGINDVRRALTDQKMSDFDRGFVLGNFLLGVFGVAQGASRFLRVIKVRLPKKFTNPFRLKGSMIPATMPEAPMIPEMPEIGYNPPYEKLSPREVPGTATPKLERIGYKSPHQELAPPKPPGTATPKPGRIGYRLPYQKLAEPQTPKAPTPDEGAISPRLHHRKPAAEATPPRSKGRIGFVSSEEREPKLGTAETPAPKPRRRIGFVSSKEPVPVVETPSGAYDQPAAVGEPTGSGGVISEMPRAREVSGSHRPGGDTGHAPLDRPGKVVGSSAPETPLATGGEAPTAESPTKGSAVSTVEHDIPVEVPPATAPPTPVRLARTATAAKRVAETQQALETARMKRAADEARVNQLNEELEAAERLRESLGSKRKGGHIDDALKKAKRDLTTAQDDLKTSKKAETIAHAQANEAAQEQEDIRTLEKEIAEIGREPFDMEAIGVPAETPQMVGKNLRAAKLKPGQKALYILREVGGKILKVGKTSFKGIKQRARRYMNAARENNIEVEWELYPLEEPAKGARKPKSAEYYEQKLRDAMEARGQEMPWDNTGGRLGRKGFGTPGEGVRRSKISREEMEALLRKHKGNVDKVGEELGKHGRTVRLWAKDLGLDPKDFKK